MGINAFGKYLSLGEIEGKHGYSLAFVYHEVIVISGESC